MHFVFGLCSTIVAMENGGGDHLGKLEVLQQPQA